MKSTELKRVVVFSSAEDFKKGIELIVEDVAYEYSGFLHTINFYTYCEFSIAYRRFEKAGMTQDKNFTVHAWLSLI